MADVGEEGDASAKHLSIIDTSLSIVASIYRFDHHIVMREEIKEDRRRQKREARLETARRGAEAAATEEINKE